jgi:hypothetical protein
MAEEKDTDGSEVNSSIEPQFVGDDVVVPTLASVPASPKPVGWLRKTLKIFGPGLVTGAADDDPSGIATYSSVGAQFGYGMLWTMPLIYPFMAAIQEISARLERSKRRLYKRQNNSNELRSTLTLEWHSPTSSLTLSF